MGGTRVLHREWSRLSLMRTILMRISRSLHPRVDMDECRLVRQHHVLLCIGTELGDSYHLLVRRHRAPELDGVGEDVRVVLYCGSLLVSVLVDVWTEYWVSQGLPLEKLLDVRVRILPWGALG
ncbi:unnamed protein product [Linum trigynum]|uniref:Uncharacterized protein n=1 Tax=Linum trigynum TaxID=586398 RepID=A0AAV2FFJ8_9ROSI